MTLSTLLARAPARATLAIGFALSLFTSSSATAQEAGAAAVATSTLDVCAAEGTGKWRYSGVVAVLDAQGGSVAADSRVQNQTSRAGYRDAPGATSAPAAAGTRAGDTVVLPYVVEAAPLTLGVVRSETQVQLNGQPGAAGERTLVAQSGTVTGDTVTGCEQKGCVRTQGYWGNKPGVVWPQPYLRTKPFFSSGLTWQQILDTPPRGGGYIILAHQYIAAVLNRAAGASAPSGVVSVINAATAWFNSGTTPSTCGPGQCALQKTWAGTLDAYNNGTYPGAPKHCK
jgi:hypothetical protein